MLDWLENQLAADTNQFIIQNHVYPGNNYYGGLEIFWDTDLLNRLHQIINDNKAKYIVGIGAHIHKSDFMAPLSATQPGLYLTQIISPAISPVYNNNPGYGMLSLETVNKSSNTLKIKDYTSRFLSLMDYEQFGMFTFQNYNLQS